MARVLPPASDYALRSAQPRTNIGRIGRVGVVAAVARAGSARGPRELAARYIRSTSRVDGGH